MIYACSWPVYQTYSGMTPNYTSIINTCNLWRNFDDIQDSWSSVERTIDYYGDNQVGGAGHKGDKGEIVVTSLTFSFHRTSSSPTLAQDTGTTLTC